MYQNNKWAAFISLIIQVDKCLVTVVQMNELGFQFFSVIHATLSAINKPD